MADKIGGLPDGSIGDIPMTAHFLGGRAIGGSPHTGATYRRIDPVAPKNPAAPGAPRLSVIEVF